MVLWVTAAWAAPVDGLTARIGNRSVGYPFSELLRSEPLAPEVELDAEHRWVGRSVVLAQEARAQLSQHVIVGTTAELGTDLVLRGVSSPGPLAEVGLGVGVVDQWRPRETLRWDTESQTWEEASRSRLGLSGGFVLGLGWDLGARTRVPLTPLIQYRWSLQGPFLPAVPVAPLGTLSLGLRWQLGENP